MNYGFMQAMLVARLLRLEICCPNHRAPFLSFVRNELGEVRRRARKHHTAQLGKPRLHPGISEASVYLLVQLVNDLGGCALGYSDAIPLGRLKSGHEFVHGRQVREPLSAHGTRYRKRSELAGSHVLDCCRDAAEYHLHLS